MTDIPNLARILGSAYEDQLELRTLLRLASEAAFTPDSRERIDQRINNINIRIEETRLAWASAKGEKR